MTAHPKRPHQKTVDKFILAAAKGNLSTLQAMFNTYGAAILNRQDDEENTALSAAAWEGHIDCLRFLLEQKADFNIVNATYETPLSRAVMAQEVSCMNELIKAGAPVDVQEPDGFTALIYAARDDSVECLDILLAHNANPNAKLHDSWTALMLAVNNNSKLCVKSLVLAGANPALCGKDGKSALDFAVGSEYTSLIAEWQAERDRILQQEKIVFDRGIQETLSVKSIRPHLQTPVSRRRP